MRRYENPEFLHEGTMPPRAHYIPYGSLASALAGDPAGSEYHTLLSGEWDFRYFKSPSEIENETLDSLHKTDADKKLGKATVSTVISIGGSWAIGSLGAQGGAMAGALLGSAIFPGPGTAIGGTIGGFAGGVIGSHVGSYSGDVLGEYIVDITELE